MPLHVMSMSLCLRVGTLSTVHGCWNARHCVVTLSVIVVRGQDVLTSITIVDCSVVLFILFFFFLMIRPPPSSPLFPSPTLFRPPVADQPRRQRAPVDPREATLDRPRQEARVRDPDQVRRDEPQVVGGGHPAGVRPVEPRQAHGDRKSTRLNSSHSQISYAVFCLH